MRHKLGHGARLRSVCSVWLIPPRSDWPTRRAPDTGLPHPAFCFPSGTRPRKKPQRASAAAKGRLQPDTKSESTGRQSRNATYIKIHKRRGNTGANKTTNKKPPAAGAVPQHSRSCNRWNQQSPSPQPWTRRQRQAAIQFMHKRSLVKCFHYIRHK